MTSIANDSSSMARRTVETAVIWSISALPSPVTISSIIRL
jgi:hypothetical protein